MYYSERKSKVAQMFSSVETITSKIQYNQHFFTALDFTNNIFVSIKNEENKMYGAKILGEYTYYLIFPLNESPPKTSPTPTTANVNTRNNFTTKKSCRSSLFWVLSLFFFCCACCFATFCKTNKQDTI